MSKYPVIVGRFEHVDLVNKLDAIPAKIDTGAYRSSIHASDVAIITKNNVKVLRFTLLGHPVFQKKRTLETRKFSQITVRSSNGHKSVRYEVTLKLRLGYKVFSTSFALSDRSDNVFPVLIGRKALRGRFLVDADKAGVSRLELILAKNQLSVSAEDMEGVNT